MRTHIFFLLRENVGFYQEETCEVRVCLHYPLNMLKNNLLAVHFSILMVSPACIPAIKVP